MISALILVGTPVCIVALILAGRWWRMRRRRILAGKPFPDAWETILQEDFPVYKHLPLKLQRQLQERIQIFLAEKKFVGCRDLQVTDDMRVLIAAQAGLLILNRKTDYYSGLETILIYPSAYVAKASGPDGCGIVHESSGVRLGESWHAGPVVLSWNDVSRDAYNIHDGRNVTMHEFAHQLDQADDASDGTPVLGDQAKYAGWARTFKKDFVDLRKKLERGGHDILNSYAATDPAEFFAVATEVFFEKPRLLQKRHPALYEQLRIYYCLDPGEWDE